MRFSELSRFHSPLSEIYDHPIFELDPNQIPPLCGFSRRQSALLDSPSEAIRVAVALARASRCGDLLVKSAQGQSGRIGWQVFERCTARGRICKSGGSHARMASVGFGTVYVL